MPAEADSALGLFVASVHTLKETALSGLIFTGRDPRTGRMVQVETMDGDVQAVRRIDGESDLWLAPGLVDLQVNGFRHHDVNAADVDATTVIKLVRSLEREGVTTVVPTIVTASEARITAALRAVAAARAEDSSVARAIPYVHVEGPFLSEEDGPRGAHDLSQIRKPDLEELARWQQACGVLVGMVTISPHSDAAIEFISEATRLGVRCAIGHTHATPEQISRAASAGAQLSTHLGNGAHALLPRHPNYIWAQLAEDKLSAGFIADGHHLSAETFRAMLRAKGLSRSHLVSDTTTIAGMAAGQYSTSVGSQVELSNDGRLSLAGTPFLAGAARPLADGVATAIEMANLTLHQGLSLATANPGRFVGHRGTLTRGRPADLIGFRWRPGDTGLDIQLVVASGVVVVGADSG
jgi:N-acetylglucosamine-6-phosphate deacetylase